ncbi:MAG: hypothetical protein GY797_33565 [Deltaproteobacteria bacterium]|nr:hypothetical protein [Deltaproteobacteria bacterium]
MMEGKPLISYDYGGDLGVLVLERSCSKCGRFIKAGKVKIALESPKHIEQLFPTIKFIYKNWYCKNCGKTEPFNLGWF